MPHKKFKVNYLNSIKASFKQYSLSGNKSKNLHGHNPPNLGPPVTSSTTARHVGSNLPEGSPHGYTPSRTATNLNSGATQEPNERPLNPIGAPQLIPSTERRKARTIQNLPEALRHQVTATPVHFHETILQAYNKPPLTSATGMSVTTPPLVAM